MAGFFHTNGDIGLTHRQVKNPLLQHQLDIEIGVFFVKLWQAWREPERAEARCCGDTQFTKHFILTVANPCGGSIKPFGHGASGVKQQFALLGKN